MKLRSLYIDYFMSFGPGNLVDLADRGLVLINGINEISDMADSNGAGKTSLQEALLWSVYGKTTKDVGVNDVVNNIHKKDCFVRAIFEDGDFDYRIERYRKHSEHGDDLKFVRVGADGEENLAGVDKAETQKRIEQFMGCGYTLFCNSAYFSQNNVKPFSTYTDKQIKEVFIDALDFTRFTNGLEKARHDLKVLREELATIQGRKERLLEEAMEAETRKADYKSRHDTFGDIQKADLAEFDNQIKTVQDRIASLDGHAKQIKIIGDTIATYQKTVAKLPEHLDIKTSLAETSNRFRDSFNLIKHKAADAERTLSIKNRELKQVSSRVGTNCTECGKLITEADLADVIAGIKTQIETTSAELAKYQTLVTRAEPQLKTYQTQETEIDTNIAACQKAERTIADLKLTLSRIEASTKESAMLAAKIVELQELKAKKAEEKSPWKDYIEKEQTTVNEANVKIDAIASVIAEKEEEIRYIEFWEAGFGYSGVPSFLLDTVTPFLNEQANHHSTTVTGGEIDFNTVTKLKGGDLKDKFSIGISHKTGAKLYKGISGGERKRADVCIAQSIQDLVRSFGRNTLSYCSYDEPFENLDNEGVANVVEMLQEISKEIGTVLVVTHNSELKAMFDNTITIVKGKDGYSRILA